MLCIHTHTHFNACRVGLTLFYKNIIMNGMSLCVCLNFPRNVLHQISLLKDRVCPQIGSTSLSTNALGLPSHTNECIQYRVTPSLPFLLLSPLSLPSLSPPSPFPPLYILPLSPTLSILPLPPLSILPLPPLSILPLPPLSILPLSPSPSLPHSLNPSSPPSLSLYIIRILQSARGLCYIRDTRLAPISLRASIL